MDVRSRLKVVAAGLGLAVMLMPVGPMVSRAFAAAPADGSPYAYLTLDGTGQMALPSDADTTPVLPSTDGMAASVATIETPAGMATADVAPEYTDAQYGYLWTPSHGQERPYWCGPASCQIVLHYFGNLMSQPQLAYVLGTTTSGTSITRVDDCLRAYAGRSYECFSGNTTSSMLTHVAHSIATHRQPVIADVRIMPGTWWAYHAAHLGHIIPVEAFDWRYGIVRVNDPYNERSWRSGGGQTGGHTTYPTSALISGVALHPQHAVVAAP